VAQDVAEVDPRAGGATDPQILAGRDVAADDAIVAQVAHDVGEQRLAHLIGLDGLFF
jgi:hypothetical protein